jgi:restriction-modification system family protein
MITGLKTYSVSRAARQPLLDFMLNALRAQGCRIIYCSGPETAPFVITFELRSGERMGIVAYAFLATRTVTKNRPKDERSFQVKYGSKAHYFTKNSHRIWSDPLGLLTTLFLGISPEDDFFVAADPSMHNPTKFFIRVEFKDRHAEEIDSRGWFAWERDRRNLDEPVEVLIGGKSRHFLDLIRFEHAAEGLDQGNRQLLADRRAFFTALPVKPQDGGGAVEKAIHPLAKELELSSEEILNVIASARMLKMAVRGWVAEEHLRATLANIPGVTDCERLDHVGSSDLRIRFRGGPPLTVECKNVLRMTDQVGRPRLDFQRTRAAKSDPCSRYYAPTDFDVIAACLHAVTERWEFRYVLPGRLPAHAKCPGKITSNIAVGEQWSPAPEEVLTAANTLRG